MLYYKKSVEKLNKVIPLCKEYFLKNLQKKSNYKENYVKKSFEERWFNYQEEKKHAIEDFSEKMDPINVLFRFYGFILLITIVMALMVFIGIMVFDKVSIFSLFFLPSFLFINFKKNKQNKHYLKQ